jgi:hypothetical protein
MRMRPHAQNGQSVVAATSTQLVSIKSGVLSLNMSIVNANAYVQATDALAIVSQGRDMR